MRDKAVERANERLEEAGEAPLPALTPHGLRRSFASLLYGIGEPPPVVMQEMGHTDPALALSIYAHAMRRDDGENERLRALVEGAESSGFGPVHIPTVDDSTMHRTVRRGGIPLARAGWRGTRPEGFEPSTSASGGQRSIH